MLRYCKDCSVSFDGRGERCRVCSGLYRDRKHKEWQQRAKEKRITSLGGPWPCEVCGERNIWREKGRFCEGCRDEAKRRGLTRRGRSKQLVARLVPAAEPAPPTPCSRATTLADTPPQPSRTALNRTNCLTGAAAATKQAREGGYALGE